MDQSMMIVLALVAVISIILILSVVRISAKVDEIAGYLKEIKDRRDKTEDDK